MQLRRRWKLPAAVLVILLSFAAIFGTYYSENPPGSNYSGTLTPSYPISESGSLPSNGNAEGDQSKELLDTSEYDVLMARTVNPIASYRFFMLDFHWVQYTTKLTLRNEFKVPESHFTMYNADAYCQLQTQYDPSTHCDCNNDGNLCSIMNSRGFTSAHLPKMTYESERSNPSFLQQDILVFHFPPATAEFFMAFDKPILINMAWRIDHRRYLHSEHNVWLTQLFQLLSRPNVVIASQSVYDVEYLYYFTGLNATLLEPFSYYASGYSYNITHKTFLAGPSRETSKGARTAIANAVENYKKKSGKDVSVNHIADEFKERGYTFEQLATYPAIICFPYAAWSLAFNDYYALGVPLIFPSIRFLAELHLTSVNLLTEITSASNYWGDVNNEPKVPFWKGKRHPFDPESILTDRAALEYWLQYAWYYQWPHIQYYESWEELMVLCDGLTEEKLYDISAKMKETWQRKKTETRERWSKVLVRLTNNIEPNSTGLLLPTFGEQMKALYGNFTMNI
eukprot:TRINITY_DN2110_c0_g2_i1.p1 TRINITY_DN2110_c0_g2~~TRINITY_DN2110_c0_g2_i1.p1  ORF type:complete len:510 (+),score=56.35 TRINITY_DN2110_c0_g2_i1:26-1555(+)